MKLLVLGISGMLGHRLFHGMGAAHEVWGTCRVAPDAADETAARLISGVCAEDMDSVEAAVARVRPDAVLNCVGIIKQKPEAKHHIQCIYINALFPHKLAEVCSRYGARLFHFSTDCVFSGKKGGYAEHDFPDAEDLYGRTKFLGELPYRHCVTIRSSIIGLELGSRQSLVEWVISNRGGEVKGYTKAMYTGFITAEMGRIVEHVLVRCPSLHGVYQAASAKISKHDLICLMNEKMNLGMKVVPDGSFVCDRSLDGERFERESGYKPPSWDDMVSRLAEEYFAREKGR